LYVSSYTEVLGISNYLSQFDLNATNIAASRIVLDSFPSPEGINGLKLGPDNKIYVAAQYEPSYFNFPYPDSVHNYITDNLSVINQPDSPGVACDLQKFSVYLGGRRTYGCLPNNPNYELGPLVGSACDTLSTGINQVQEPKAQMYITYEPNWRKVFVNASRLHGQKCRLTLYDINGRLIDMDVSESNGGYYTKSIEMAGYASGVYVAKLETEREILTGKIVVP
jgi:Secretion system C-terminal sorting domain